MGDVNSMCHLHVHTELGGFDGFGSVDDFVRTAAERGDPAFGVTEHGTLRGIHELDRVCKEHNVHPVYGIEFYVVEDMRQQGLSEEDVARVQGECASAKERKEAAFQEELRLGLRDREHLTVFASTQDGLRNLFRLSSLSWLEGFYHRPRIDMKALEAHADGLIVASGCVRGPIAQEVLKGNFDKAIELTEWFKRVFGDRFYMEIMPHSLSDQTTVNLGLVEIAREMGVPLLATQDAHYIGREDWRHQEEMLCVHGHDVMMNPARFKFSTHDFWLRSRQEMEEAFAQYHPALSQGVVQTALDNTLVLAARCDVTLRAPKPYVPRPEVPEGVTDDEHLRNLCEAGWVERDIVGRAARRATVAQKEAEDLLVEYQRRLDFELGVIRDRGITDYFLVIHDMYAFARREGIFMGPGRGSAAGCLVSFLIGLTQVDPLEHGLLFERFLAPGRADLPDIDCDVEDGRRDELIAYMQRRWGSDKFARISTVTSMRARMALKDAGRIWQIPLREVEAVAAQVPEKYITEEDRDACVLGDIFKEDDLCQDFAHRYPPVAECAISIEGGVRALGVHPAGIVVSPVPLIDICPLEIRTSKGEVTVVTALDMHGVESLGLVKIDILGLRNLTVIRDSLRGIASNRNKAVDMTRIPLDDKKSLRVLTKRLFTGIFQLDTPLGYRLCEGFRFTSFADIAAISAISRPGVSHSGLAEEYLRRKASPNVRRSVHPVVDAICEDTVGVMVFQEHLMQILSQVAGYDPIRVNTVRKMVGKKAGKEHVRVEMEFFIDSAINRGFPEGIARTLAEQMMHMGAYAFNKSHAVSYGLIAYWEAWLKAHYPLEFLWALLCNSKDDDDRVRFVDEADRLGITILPPDVNVAGSEWKLTEAGLVMSLRDLKGIGPAAVAAIEEARPYTDFLDLMKRVDKRRCSRKVVSILLRTGSLNGIVPNPAWLDEHLEVVWKMEGKKGWEEAVATVLAESTQFPGWDDQTFAEKARPYSPIGMKKT